MNAVKAVFGVGLLALAIWMLERIVQGPVILVLWGLLAIGSGVFMGALEPAGQSGWKRTWKTLGLVLLLVGAMELIGAATGADNWMKPLERLSVSGSHETAAHIEFRRIKSLDDLQSELSQASSQGKPAMLDFYADWCVECIRMERNTFPDERVQSLLAQMQPLQADVTPNDDIDQALMKEFGIIGPPAILFFDRRGVEMRPYRLVGYFTPDEFGDHLQKVVAAP
jgi:thiol:disulfide interchange protein DsbD